MVAVDRRRTAPGVSSSIDPANGDVLADVDTPYPAGWNGLAFDPGGAELAVAYAGSGGDPAVGRFDVASGRAAGTYSGPAGSYEQLSYHPDGQMARGGTTQHRRTGDGDRCLGRRLRRRADLARAGDRVRIPTWYHLGRDRGRRRRKDRSPSSTSRRVRWSGRSRSRRTSTTRSRSIRPASTWRRCRRTDRGRRRRSREPRAGRPRRRLRPRSAELSPDGQWLAISDSDNLVHLYDTENFAETLLAGSPNTVTDVSFAPDGSQLASISAGQLRFWALAPEGHPALGNFATSGPVDELVVAERESAAVVTVESPDASVTVERIDLAIRRGRPGRRRAPLPSQQPGSGALRRRRRGRRARRHTPHRRHRPRHRSRSRTGTLRDRACPRPPRAPGAHRRADPVSRRRSAGRAARPRRLQPRARPARPAARSSTSAPGPSGPESLARPPPTASPVSSPSSTATTTRSRSTASRPGIASAHTPAPTASRWPPRSRPTRPAWP